MSSHSIGQQELANIIRTYKVPVDTATLSAALSDDEQARLLCEWVRAHLTQDTLLTKDELTSYHSLQRAGKVDSLTDTADLAKVQALSTREIQDAIDELDRSTDAINKQTETLVQQQDALSRLLTSSDRNGDARAGLEVTRLQKWESDRKGLDASVELLSQGLSYRVSELEQHDQHANEDMTALVDDLLHADDKLLLSLQKLGWELGTDDPEESESVSKLREICARLIKYTVKCLRTKLDRVFLETLESHMDLEGADLASTDDINGQQAELEELYTEILPVAQMSVEQQWLEPSLRSLHAKNVNSTHRCADGLAYIMACLDFLLDRLDRTYKHVSTFKAHEVVASTLVAAAKTELANNATSRPKRRSTHRSSSMTMDMQTPAPKTKGQSSIVDSPLDRLLSELAIFLPVSGDPSKCTTQAHVRLVANALADRTRKLADVSRDVQLSFEKSSSAHMADARSAVQLVRDSVLAESPYAEVHLADPGIEGSIGVLAQEVHSLHSRLDGVDKEAAVLTKGRNAKKDEILKRWGHAAG
ncbi:hypothetical protein BD289DRAFT_454963 [Coniella lustricola]|uniref:Uncharacterized protein n=1 Tax=Coniella lustricola TaxID=2025994 RepID=A0A2T3A1F8_9PEZI|nr:hypothetical protein BD289DRAFT_454963 [Coniella lustricola]